MLKILFLPMLFPYSTIYPLQCGVVARPLLLLFVIQSLLKHDVQLRLVLFVSIFQFLNLLSLLLLLIRDLRRHKFFHLQQYKSYKNLNLGVINYYLVHGNEMKVLGRVGRYVSNNINSIEQLVTSEILVFLL